MRIKKLSVRMLVSVFLGLCAGIAMEHSTGGLKFPIFLIIGIIAGMFVEIVIEVLICKHTVTREDLRKMKKPVLRILVASSIGLLAGMVLEYAAIWAGFPIFLILGVLAGAGIGITIELVRYSRSVRRAFLEGKGLGMESLPVSTAELIRLVIKKMRYHKEVRTEVMAELAEHFEDELQDCRTDEDKEQKAKELIAEFGDAKLLAVLLRRAKKRCRPLWRTVVAKSFQAVGALILCFIVYAVWFSTGKPTISVDYLALLNQLNRPEVHDEDNAWPHYQKAIELYSEPDQRIPNLTERRLKEFKKRLHFSDLKKEKRNQIKEWLATHESHWNDLDLSQKRLIGRCFQEGLVPLADIAYIGKYSSKRYRVFDNAVEDIIKKIERQQWGRRPDRSSDYGNETMMEMEMMYGHGPYRRNQRDIEMDSDIALDSEIISLFGAYSQEELRKIKIGIEAGVIKEWIDNPPVVVTSLLDYLLPFEKKLIVKWVEDNEAAWKEYVAGSSKSYCYRKYKYTSDKGTVLFNVDLSHLRPLRDLARVGAWRSLIEMESGNTQKGLQNCLVIAKAGRHWRGKGAILEQLVGMYIENYIVQTTFAFLDTNQINAELLKNFQDKLEDIVASNT